MRRTASALALGKDVDGGLVYQGFSPKTQTGRLPVDKSVSKPFLFGGSNVRYYFPMK
jgi:hypothetical protein